MIRVERFNLHGDRFFHDVVADVDRSVAHVADLVHIVGVRKVTVEYDAGRRVEYSRHRTNEGGML